MLSTRFNFLFIHTPKTGGNAIQRVLLPFSDDEMALVQPFHDGIDRFEIRSPVLNIHKHSSLQDYQRQLPPEVFARVFKFTCVRNPWDRCVSFFFSPHRGKVEWSPDAFHSFIADHVAPQSDYLALQGQSCSPFDNLDTVLRFETLHADFVALCQRLGLACAALPVANASRRGPYQQYYGNPATADLVRQKFAPEIERFGYRF